MSTAGIDGSRNASIGQREPLVRRPTRPLQHARRGLAKTRASLRRRPGDGIFADTLVPFFGARHVSQHGGRAIRRCAIRSHRGTHVTGRSRARAFGIDTIETGAGLGSHLVEATADDAVLRACGAGPCIRRGAIGIRIASIASQRFRRGPPCPPCPPCPPAVPPLPALPAAPPLTAGVRRLHPYRLHHPSRCCRQRRLHRCRLRVHRLPSHRFRRKLRFHLCHRRPWRPHLRSQWYHPGQSFRRRRRFRWCRLRPRSTPSRHRCPARRWHLLFRCLPCRYRSARCRTPEKWPLATEGPLLKLRCAGSLPFAPSRDKSLHAGHVASRDVGRPSHHDPLSGRFDPISLGKGSIRAVPASNWSDHFIHASTRVPLRERSRRATLAAQSRPRASPARVADTPLKSERHRRVVLEPFSERPGYGDAVGLRRPCDATRYPKPGRSVALDLNARPASHR